MHEDLRKSYPRLVAEARITLVEAGTLLLSTFDKKLRDYASALFRRQNIRLLTGSPVVEIDPETIRLADGTTLSYGLLLWSTGNGPTPFAQRLRLPSDRQSRILTDRYFRVKGEEHIYALGDCAVIDGAPLPATAQVAQQEGKYLAHALRNIARGRAVEPFQYRHLGMLAYIGSNKALADLETFKGRGFATWLFWRSAYLSRIVSVKNKVLVLFDWIKAQFFGRDISQF
jgi:NADH:ubiquinone reductase (non-electrogenic)